ncbi:chemotaxis protein histidine kinase-like protein [Xenococcus sp. PCC 7305]|uniref:Hpt domain-containing protein n=1 Tax=Xenococcus sp. PCC 7305 TaxID=102125 RepID=UPI0002ACD030|nr:Hpt domain-containing protein [Xenococcus sp. PCC 7305]ELS02020.1 chemotaxis protein histidine kinase-like protein [Xenococcus sp. PCC 7305]
MDTASQQRILGYFIEEAKEHLQTLEQGILNLSTSAQDAEMVNEMFRAAHSVKGGAAMLGYSSIQKTAHRLEDSFKILKDNSINVDQKLESLFLAGCDHLQDLIDRLESSPDFSDADAIETLEKAESNFSVLQSYLECLLSEGASENSPATVNIAEEVTAILKQMLQLFKQADSPANRQELQKLAQSLGTIAPEQATWQKFIAIATKAISNRKYPFKTIAQIVIRDIKQAGDNLDQGKINAIVPSKNLQQLAATAPASNETAAPVAAQQIPQIPIPKEPVAAANMLKKVFNSAELSQIIKILSS